LFSAPLTYPKPAKSQLGIAISEIRQVTRIAAREDAYTIVDDGKDPAAKALGAKGGKKRAENLTPERRAEIARKAAESRWKK